MFFVQQGVYATGQIPVKGFVWAPLIVHQSIGKAVAGGIPNHAAGAVFDGRGEFFIGRNVYHLESKSFAAVGVGAVGQFLSVWADRQGA